MGRHVKEPPWSDVKSRIKDLNQAQLLGLVRELFDLTQENRQFLTARYRSDGASLTKDDWTARPLQPPVIPNECELAPFQERIKQAFYVSPRRPAERLDYAAARKAIRDYQKATGNFAGTVSLMIHYVEVGTRFTLDFGDIDGPFYNSLVAMWDRIAKALKTNEGRVIYPQVRERLQTLRARAFNRIGWGYGDDVADIVDGLEQHIHPGSPKQD